MRHLRQCHPTPQRERARLFARVRAVCRTPHSWSFHLSPNCNPFSKRHSIHFLSTQSSSTALGIFCRYRWTKYPANSLPPDPEFRRRTRSNRLNWLE